MSDNYRMERIERLLKELEYEVTRGMMEAEIDESLGYIFIVPISKALHGGMVHCQFRTRPVHRDSIIGRDMLEPPRLRIVK
jgi:hypothetical protein